MRGDATTVLFNVCGKYFLSFPATRIFKRRACGPYRMLEAVAKSLNDGEVSLEARMGCGFGACMGCSIKTISGPKRVCKEGPVFKGKEVLW